MTLIGKNSGFPSSSPIGAGAGLLFLSGLLFIMGPFGGGCSGGDPARNPGITAGRPPDPMPPANAVGGFSIELPAITVQPGQEMQPCFVFPLNIAGPSRLVSAAVLTTVLGMHHGNITTRAITGDGIRMCDSGSDEEVAIEVAAGGAVLFASSTQVQGTEWLSFPPGMAFSVPDGQEIVARMHYLNASTQPITLSPKYQWFTIAQSDLTQQLAPFAWDYTQFHIPPLSQYTVSGNCPIPRPMFVVETLPHMHALGTRFTLGLAGGPLDGTLVFDDDTYSTRGESDIRIYDPPVDLSQGGQGTGATFSCTWNNTYDQVIQYGVGINEMCILFGYAYPPANTFSAAAAEGIDCTTLVAG